MRRSISGSLVLLFGLACQLASANVFGQGFQGGLRGAVRDANGVIPGAEVVLLNEATNSARTAVTNSAGEYAYVAVEPGTYTVRAALQGFKTYERKGLTIGTQQFITLDLLMEVGALEETVTVTGAAPLIETSNASTGQVLDQKTLESLPALNRNIFMVAASVPTVILYGDPYQSRMEDQSNGSSVSLGGGMRRGNSYTLDGVSLSDLQNRAAAFPTMEGVEDTKVQVHTYDAEMGRTGGGVFNTTAKSGTNVFHGSGFFQVRPNALAATSYFDRLLGKTKPDGPFYYYNGESFGGPLKKNRVFFWSAHEGYRESLSGTSAGVVPTDLERAGNFSQDFDRNGNLIVIYDPLTTRQLPNGTYTRDPFPGNIIPANRMSQVASNILKYFPRADTQVSGANGLSNYQYTSQIPTYADQYMNKGEVKITDSVSVTGLYLFQNSSEQHTHFWTDSNGQYVSASSPAAPAGPDQGDELRQIHVIALNNTMVLNSSTTATLRYGYTRFNDHVLGHPYDPGQLGFPAAFVSALQYGRFPNGTIQGYSVGAGGTFGNRPESVVDYPQWNLNGSLTKLVGRHTTKVGADWRTIGALADAPQGASSGTFNFDKEWTQASPLVPSATQGNALASFLLGLPSANAGNLSFVPISTPIDVTINSFAVYVQDDFRASSNVTLNMGLRYEYETGMREAENRFTVAFDRAAVSPLAAPTGLDLHGGLRYAGKDGFPTYQGNPSKTKFSPRVGAAWSLNDKTVVRAGYGLYWAPWLYSGPGTTSYGQIGYTQQTFVTYANNLIPTLNLDNPFPNGLQQPIGNSLGLLTGVGGQIQYVNENRASPRVQEYSLDIQRELPGKMAVSVTYMGTRGDNLSSGSGLNINQLDPQYLALGSALNAQVPNPFFGIPQAGAFSASPTIARGQLLRPFPQFGNVLMLQDSGGRSRYNSVIVQLNKRQQNGVAWRFNYTFSRLFDNQVSESGSFASGNQGGRMLNNYNPDLEYSISQLDVPHRIQISPIVELPFGKGRRWATRGIASWIAGGWSVSSVMSYESGQPVNVVQSSDNTGSFSGQQRPNLVPGVSPTTPGDTLDRLNTYINPAAFVAAPPFTFGNAPRTQDSLRSPFRHNYDLVLAKAVPVTDKVRAQLKLEILNLTNSPKFLAGPAASFGTATFGTITQQAGFSRLAQLLLRFDF
jgi:trimeric autotransporter adhesin